MRRAYLTATLLQLYELHLYGGAALLWEGDEDLLQLAHSHFAIAACTAEHALARYRKVSLG